MTRQTHTTALIAFSVIATATLAQGSRPPRLPRREVDPPHCGRLIGAGTVH